MRDTAMLGGQLYIYFGDQLGVDHVLLIILTYVNLYVDAIDLPCK